MIMDEKITWIPTWQISSHGLLEFASNPLSQIKHDIHDTTSDKSCLLINPTVQPLDEDHRPL